MRRRKEINGDRPHFKNYGFTLVELLVVIGIIAVLISLLLPALNTARTSAKRIACSSNLRQFGVALTMYTSETKGWLPAPWGNAAQWTGQSWDETLAPYLGKKVTWNVTTQPPTNARLALLRCPLDNFPDWNGVQRRSYKWNGGRFNVTDAVDSPSDGRKPIRVNNIKPMFPAATGNNRNNIAILLDKFEPERPEASMGWANGSSGNWWAFGPDSPGSVRTGHPRKERSVCERNALFLDGRVETLTFSAQSAMRSLVDYTAPNFKP